MAAGSSYSISGSDLSTDDLRSLRHWMFEVHDLNGPIDLRQGEPQPGELGTLTDALVVAVGSGGALTALAGALISWLRHRTSDLTLKVTRPDGSVVELAGHRLHALGPAEVAEILKGMNTNPTSPPAASLPVELPSPALPADSPRADRQT